MSLDPRYVSACFITKDATYPSRIVEQVMAVGFGELLFLTNCPSPHLKQRLFEKAAFPYLYYQDDDCIAPIDELFAQAQPDIITCAMKPSHLESYKNSRIALLGWGSIFPQSTIKVLDQYRNIYGEDHLFRRESERIMTWLSWPQQRLALPIEDLPSAWAPDRLSMQPDHYSYIPMVEERLNHMAKKIHQAPYGGPMAKKKKPIPTPTPAPGTTLTIQSPGTQNATSTDGNPVTVSYPPPVTTGGVIPITISYSQASGTLFPVGTTAVTATARSSDGQVASCQFNVVVSELPPPPPPGPTGGLIQAGNLIYQGAFRVPQGAFGDPDGNGFGFGGMPIGFNPNGPSLFAAARNGELLAEFTIPTPVHSSNLADVPFASVLQTFRDPTEGHWGPSSTSGTIPAACGGLVVHGSDLHCAGFIFYDADNTTTVSQFKRALNLSTPSFSGWQPLWQAGSQGYVGRALAVIPSEWQSAFGGDLLASGWGLPIISRESVGPDAFAFSSADVNGGGLIAAHPLLYYPSNHTTLGTWEASTDPVYNWSSDYGGMVIVPGWRSLLVFGRTAVCHATNPLLGQDVSTHYYGDGTSDWALNGVDEGGGDHYAYDPTDSSKGTHGWPYIYYVWAYDLNDLAAVKAGTKQPWEPVPYATWQLSLPFAEGACKGLSATIDPATGTIYVSQLRADLGNGFFAGPVMHAFTVQ